MLPENIQACGTDTRWHLQRRKQWTS